MTELPQHIPTSDGDVILGSQRHVFLYENFKFAAARRAGNSLYVSGVIAGPEKGEGRDAEAFRNQLRRAFGDLKTTLAAAGSDFSRVVMINSFHVWTSDNFQGDKSAQLAAFIAVKDEFMPPPHPAWTAIGTTGLAIDTGVVEIQLIAHV